MRRLWLKFRDASCSRRGVFVLGVFPRTSGAALASGHDVTPKKVGLAFRHAGQVQFNSRSNTWLIYKRF
jgi:hypothetical protein